MIYTNLIDRAQFDSIDGTEFDLSSFIPGGALDASHILIRYRPVGAYWSAWGAVDSWDNDTRVATWSRPALTLQSVQLQRVTPRYSLFLDPLATTSRVSEKNFHANADQGLFVASEWAAQYGIDVNAAGLPDYGDGPNTLGLVQQTQNYWGSNANFAKTTWDFQFSGGYIDRTHVHAAALLPTGWTELTIDASENDPSSPSGAPFRFIGDYQLRLDLATLGSTITGLVIYRKTPRNVNVAVVGDDQRITATGMEPSARWAFFVAVEIGEELAKRVPPCECELYYTSTIYPILAEDSLTIGPGPMHDGQIIVWPQDDGVAIGVPVFQGTHTLVSNINFLNYTNQRDVLPDTLGIGVPIFQGTHTLVSSINFLSYTNQRDVLPDTLGIGVPVFQGTHTIVVTINFINYVNQRDVLPDTLGIGVPTFQGTHTLV